MNEWSGNPVKWKGKNCHQTLEDLWNYQEVLWGLKPKVIIEVGPGDKGTLTFIRDLRLCTVHSVDYSDAIPNLKESFTIIDSDVYNVDSILNDLRIYSPMSNHLVVCHTIRPDWGSYKAVKEWNNKEFTTFKPPYATRHTWLKRNGI